MSLLSDVEMGAIRDLAEQAMPDTCTIQTRTETNTKGSVAVTYANTYTNVKCRMMPGGLRERESVTGEKITEYADYVLTVPYDQALTARDRVVFGGQTYQITRVHADHSYRTAVRADAVLVDSGG